MCTQILKATLTYCNCNRGACQVLVRERESQRVDKLITYLEDVGSVYIYFLIAIFIA